MTATSTDTVVLDGTRLDLDAMRHVSAGGRLEVAGDGLQAVAMTAALADRLATERPLYGRTTGVGANRDQPVEGEPEAHGVAILRSHAAGWGAPLPAPIVRAALGIRANQLLAGGSGVEPALPLALAEMASGPEEDLPVVHRYGALGTSDLTALAEVGLTLLGERPRAGGHRHRSLAVRSIDALPLMSSHAFTLAEAALGCHALQRISRAALTVSALTWVALNGNLEAVGPAVRTVTPFPGAAEVARVMSDLLEPQHLEPRHIQDFFGLRTWPQVHGPLLDSLDALQQVIESSVNTASENPVFLAADGLAAHHGAFHAAYVALGLDTALLALTRSAKAGQSRISHLLTDPAAWLPRFLADPTTGASGLLIAEYAAGSALAVIRGQASTPASVQTISVSAGVEDDASFSTTAAVRMGAVVDSYRHLVAVELVCAVRALRMRGIEPGGRLAEALDACRALPADLADRDLAPDFALAEELLEMLASLAD
ncbi:aromatic amino acid ammonia-lyase [Oryzihumus sp.]